MRKYKLSTKRSAVFLFTLFVLSFAAIFLTNSTLKAQAPQEGFYPSVILKMDSSFSHHIFVAEKSSHTLYLYENKDGLPVLLKTYQMATGVKMGDKLFEGDYRTPEGIYYLTRFIPKSELLTMYGKVGEIYGAGAFVLNYPNSMDTRVKKTGSGIWIHSTNDETRIEKGLDSRGCIVVANNDLKELAQYIELNKTPMIVVHQIAYQAKKVWTDEQKQLENFIENWRKSWSEEEFNAYIANYSQESFKNSIRGNYHALAAHKKAVFSNPGKPTIQLTNLSLFIHSQYAIAIFGQDYKSPVINDSGRKMLYLKKDSFYQWKIVDEVWFTRVDLNTLTPFNPSQRFFN